MTNLNNTINERVRQDTNALSDLEKDFIKWQGEVHDAEHKVEKLQDKVDEIMSEIHSLHWYVVVCS